MDAFLALQKTEDSHEKFYSSPDYLVKSNLEPMIFTLLSACVLLAAGNALSADLPVIVGGYPPSKNVHVDPIKNSASAAISFGEKGDRDKGDIILEIPARDLKDLEFFYAGYPNGKSLRFELRARGKNPVIMDCPPAREGWRELLLRLPDSWSGLDNFTVAAIDESQEFTGWVGISALKRPPLPARLFMEWRLVLAMLWVLAIGCLVCGPVFLHQASPLVRVALAMLCIGCWSMLAFYIALLFTGQWHRIVLPLASGIGLASWIFLVVRRRNSVGSIEISKQCIMAFIVAMACFLLPVIIAGPGLKGEDPFTQAQAHYRDMSIDNRIPWILANAAMEDTYKSPLFGDWLGSDRPPLQSGLIILLEPALDWMSPVWGAFVSSCSAQGFWILGAVVLLWGLGFSGSVVKCALVTTAVSGLILLNGVFTWPKLMSTGYLLASAGVIFRCLTTSQGHIRHSLGLHAIAGALAGFAMQSHGSAAFAVLPLGVFLLFQQPWRFASPHIIFRNALVFGFCFILLQIPWSLWQKLGDPPGNRLIKWHIAGCSSIDNRSAKDTILDSYKNIDWNALLENKITNTIALFLPNGYQHGCQNERLPISPWFCLQNSTLSINSDYFGVFPALSWALPGWLALAFLCLYESHAQRRFHEILYRFLPCLLWFIATIFVWVLLMFIPDSTVNHQGPMNLALVGLLFTGASLGAISFRVWMLATAIQAGGIIWVYYINIYSGYKSLPSLFLILLVISVIIYLSKDNRDKIS